MVANFDAENLPGMKMKQIVHRDTARHIKSNR
jgi:hypothetical protein